MGRHRHAADLAYRIHRHGAAGHVDIALGAFLASDTAEIRRHLLVGHASVQCCMASAGVARPSIAIFMSHNPALRVGISADTAGHDKSTLPATMERWRCM